VAASIARGEGLVWRLANDRVVVRRVGASDAVELFGAAALVWAALDEPRSVADLAGDLDLDAAGVEDAIGVLVERGVVAEAPSPGEATSIGVRRALGFAFDVRAPEPFRSALAEAFADLPRIEPGASAETIALAEVGDGRLTVRVGDEPPLVAPAGWMLAHLLETVNARAVASLADEVPLHAASVDVDGSVVALAGPSGSGKSTLAAALVLSGGRLVAEELSALTPSGDVRPFHRPIGLRAGGAAAVGVTIPAAPDGRFDRVYPWRAPALSSGGRLRGIVLVSRRPGRPAAAEPLAPAPALAELMHSAIAADDRLVDVFRACEALVRRLPVLRLTYGEPGDAVDLLRRAVSSWTT
jgi:hypothetical protein